LKKVVVIGAGIAGLSAAASLAKEGLEVTVLEKNDKAGGRINSFSAEGFTFDMGPSWYWMPEVFENFYNKFGHTTADFYELTRLDPSYKVIFEKGEKINVPADYNSLLDLFESIEPGSAERLQKFLTHAEYKYKVGMDEFVWKPGNSILEFADLRVLKAAFKLQMFSSVSKEIKKVVKDERLRQILEFPVLFLGATPKETPALYSLMNYADLKLGTWYPKGGMYKIALAFEKIVKSLGVKIKYSEPVRSFTYSRKKIATVVTDKNEYKADFIVGNADYHHIDQNLLDPIYASYSEKYWDTRKLAPSSLIVYLGINKKLKGLEHHNLFFDADFDRHAFQIYKDPSWPDKPLFYLCCPSVTDTSVAPSGQTNLFLLLPLAPGLKDDKNKVDMYSQDMIERIQAHIGESFKENIVFKRTFCISDFTKHYNSFKGNAYGLANTLKPSLKSQKISDLLYAGQLTTPGPGLPPAIISGQVAALEILKTLKK